MAASCFQVGYPDQNDLSIVFARSFEHVSMAIFCRGYGSGVRRAQYQSTQRAMICVRCFLLFCVIQEKESPDRDALSLSLSLSLSLCSRAILSHLVGVLHQGTTASFHPSSQVLRPYRIGQGCVRLCANHCPLPMSRHGELSWCITPPRPYCANCVIS